VRLWQRAGDRAVIGVARDLGVRSPLARGDPSLALGTSTMTLMELTAAYAGVAANHYPVAPTAFAARQPSWWERLFGSRHRFTSDQHEAMERMLRQAINRGTGHAAALPVANFGKTGTSQDNRDALFVGYAGDLVVGVWVGNDDNTPLNGVYGGGTPAKIWRDFMAQALGLRAAPKPRPTFSPNPEGPIQPQDLPILGDMPIGNTDLQIHDDGAVLRTDIRGVPFDVRVDRNGVQVAPADRNRRDEPDPGDED
jgi:penicillin-binding protein 1A